MGAAGAAGACATEVSGNPNAAADKREMRSLFMGSNVLKINVNIVAPRLVAKLTRRIRHRVRAHVFAQLSVRFQTIPPYGRFALR